MMIQDPVILFLNDLLSYDIYEQFKFNVLLYMGRDRAMAYVSSTVQYTLHKTQK